MAPAFQGLKERFQSWGLSPSDAARAEASSAHDFHQQMAWTAGFAIALFVGWLVVSRRRRARLGPYGPESRRGRLGLGVLIGVLGYGFVAAPLVLLADKIVYAGRPSF